MDSNRSRSERIPGSGRLALALVAALAAVAARPAGAALPAAEGERISAQRLRFEQKCFYEIDQWKGKGEEKFLERVEAQIPIFEAAKASEKEMGELKELLGECYMRRKDYYLAAGAKDQVSRYYAKVMDLKSEYGKLKDYREEALEYVYREELDAARKAFTDNNVAEARKRFGVLLSHPKAQAEAVEKIVAIEKQEGGYKAAAEGGDLEVTDQVFEKILASIKAAFGDKLYAEMKDKVPDITQMENKRTDIKNTSQWLSIRSFDLGKSLEGVVGTPVALSLENVTFAFEPDSKDPLKRFPSEGRSSPAPKVKGTEKFKEKFLFSRGSYTACVYHASAKDRPVAVSVQFTVGDAPATFEFPNRALEGMVFVGAWKGGDGFFVDVTEVTRAQVQAVAGDDEKLRGVLKDTNEGDDAAAWFEEEAALAFEKASGKTIPTKEEWMQAAFGPYTQSQRPYPWGAEVPDGDRAYVGAAADEPKPCGGRAKGRSPFWAEDMVGNMSEWVRIDGRLWLMGGNYVTSKDWLSKQGQGNPMRDPQPGKVAYEDVTDTLSPAEKTRLNEYKIDSTQAYVTGLRMVVKVNK